MSKVCTLIIDPKPRFSVEFRYGRARITSLATRASTTDQDAALQIDALKAASCYRMFVDTISGSEQTPPGDTLIGWQLNRPGRSIRHLIDQLHPLEEKKSGSGPCKRPSTQPPPEAG